MSKKKVPDDDVLKKNCKYCYEADEYCGACKQKIKEIVNTFWWD